MRAVSASEIGCEGGRLKGGQCILTDQFLYLSVR